MDSSHWRRDGRPKAGYPTEREALSAADERAEISGGRLSVYRCPYCGEWHMGGRSTDPSR